MRFTIIILLLALSYSTSALAGNWFVKLYDDKNFTDRRLTNAYKQDIQDMNKIHSDNGKLGFNDKASSVKYCIPSYWQVALYDNKHFSGRSYILKGCGEEKDMGGFGDNASSLRWEHK